jgi:hypothetical protein
MEMFVKVRDYYFSEPVVFRLKTIFIKTTFSIYKKRYKYFVLLQNFHIILVS